MRLPSSASLLLVLAASTAGSACNSPSATVGGAETSGGSDDTGTGSPVMCTPGQTRCRGRDFLEQCGPTGAEWLQSPCSNDAYCHACDPDDGCDGAQCVSLCVTDWTMPSSAGCSFVSRPQLHGASLVPDSIHVTNPSDSTSAELGLWRVPVDADPSEPQLVETHTLGPRETHAFALQQDLSPGASTHLRRGGLYRVESNAAVTASQHGPRLDDGGGESSLLLPEPIAGRVYVVASYSPHAEALPDGGRPSYFDVIALQNATTVRWTPRVPTAGDGASVAAVAAGQTGTVELDRFDTLRIAASAELLDEVCDDRQDVSGTIVEATKPVIVIGGSRCSRVPVRGYVREDDPTDTGCSWDSFPRRGSCGPLQEVLLPLERWGYRYIAPHAPPRAPIDPRQTPVPDHWRLYGGARESTTITSVPAIFTPANCPPPNLVSADGSQCTLPERGAWIEVETPGDVNVSFDSGSFDPMMVVGYLQSRWSACELGPTPYDDPTICVDEPLAGATAIGDPAMVQLVPTDAFGHRYAVHTPEGYAQHFVQITRLFGATAVSLDEVPVADDAFEAVDGLYEVATLEIGEGTHVLESVSDFGVLQLGYSGAPGVPGHAAYAQPGGVDFYDLLDP